MTEWTIKPKGDKSYNHNVNFFNKKVSNLEAYKAASGNKNSFDAENTAVKLPKLLNSHKANNKAAATSLLQRDKEHTFAMNGLREEMTTQASNGTRQLHNDIDKLTALVQAMVSRSPKKNGQEPL